MVEDFKIVKDALKRLIEEPLDHKYLNKVEPFNRVNPTAENIALEIWLSLANFKEFKDLIEVEVWESPDCSAVYRP